MRPELKDNIIGGMVSGIVTGLLFGVLAAIFVGIFLARFANELDEKLSAKEQRQENLRFIRDVSTQDGRMPFRSLDLQEMDLSGLHLACRDQAVEGVCGTRADFSDANLSGAVMRNMDLRGADFSRADLEGADLTGSLLTGADFTTALHLEGADLDGVCYESGMADMWPDALGMEASMAGDPTSPLCNPGL